MLETKYKGAATLAHKKWKYLKYFCLSLQIPFSSIKYRSQRRITLSVLSVCHSLSEMRWFLQEKRKKTQKSFSPLLYKPWKKSSSLFKERKIRERNGFLKSPLGNYVSDWNVQSEVFLIKFCQCYAFPLFFTDIKFYSEIPFPECFDRKAKTWTRNLRQNSVLQLIVRDVTWFYPVMFIFQEILD